MVEVVADQKPNLRPKENKKKIMDTIKKNSYLKRVYLSLNHLMKILVRIIFENKILYDSLI